MTNIDRCLQESPWEVRRSSGGGSSPGHSPPPHPQPSQGLAGPAAEPEAARRALVCPRSKQHKIQVQSPDYPKPATQSPFTPPQQEMLRRAPGQPPLLAPLLPPLRSAQSFHSKLCRTYCLKPENVNILSGKLLNFLN